MDDESSVIDLACSALKSSVLKCHKKKSKRWNTEDEQQRRLAAATRAVDRAQFVLRQLVAKRTSLEYGVRVLSEYCWKECKKRLQQDNDMDTSARMLQHVFSQYLRLRDGLVLLTSGECRHPGDVREAQRNSKTKKFASKLSTQSHRNDGYTVLYSSELGYSGFGWDELYDSQVGILQVELPRALSTQWDTLVDLGAQMFESCLDQHETRTKEAQTLLEDFRQSCVRDLQHYVGTRGTVKMITQDKLEKLIVTSPNMNLSLERRASDFQVSHPLGVLPNGWTTQEWQRAMQLPPNKESKKRGMTSSDRKDDKTQIKESASTAFTVPKPKRRRVIDDSSEDEDDDENLATTGLRVRVETKKEEESTSMTSSLTAIKSKLGVDAEGLQVAREELEAEEAWSGDGKSRQHFGTRGGDSTEIQQLQVDIRRVRVKIERMKLILAKAMEMNEDDYEIWDARECLRESTMALGNDLLAMSSLIGHQGPFSPSKPLEEALELFRSARNLVKDQEVAHDGMANQSNDFSEESRMIRRNLLLLRGRAHTNIGIAAIERTLVRDGCPAVKRKSLLSEAAAELQLARNCASAIRSRAVADRRQGSSASETSLDTKRADELEALACRWLCQAQWHQLKRQEALRTLEGSRELFSWTEKISSNLDVLETQISIGIESCFSFIAIAELASEALERLNAANRGHDRFAGFTQKGEELLDIAKKAYKNAEARTTLLRQLCERNSSYVVFVDVQRENSIPSVSDIQVAAEELQFWWTLRKTSPASISGSEAHHVSSDERPRNDLFASESSHAGSIPTRRLTVGRGKPRLGERRNHSRIRNVIRHRTISVPEICADGNGYETGTRSPDKYRKWGDALLPQIITASGEHAPKVEYPACAPVRPHDF